MYVCNIYTYIYVNICIWRWTQGEETDVTAPELPFTYRIFNTLVPLQSCRLRMQKNNPFRNMTTKLNWERQLWTGTRMSKSGMWTAALERERRLCHLAFTVIYTLCIYSTYIYIYTCLLLAIQKNLHVYICLYIIYIYTISLHIYPILYIYIYIFIYMPSISRTENLQVCKKLNFGCFENMKKCLASVFWPIKKTLKQDGCKATLHFSYYNIWWRLFLY